MCIALISCIILHLCHNVIYVMLKRGGEGVQSFHLYYSTDFHYQCLKRFPSLRYSVSRWGTGVMGPLQLPHSEREASRACIPLIKY